MRLDRPLQRVRRRLRMQAALEGGALAAVVAGALLLVGVYLWRLHVLSPRGLLAVALTAGGVVVAGVVARAIARIPLDRAALQIDQSHALHDRVRSALAFKREADPTPFMQAAIADADEAAARIDARRAAPLARPDALTPAAILGCVAALVALLHFPTRSHGVPETPRPPHLVVDRGLLDPEMQAARALEAAAKQAGDVDAQKLAEELNQLLTQIDAEELTRKQAFDKLAELENKYLHADDGQLEYLKDKLRKAGAELGKSKLLEETGKSLKDDDVEKARKELEQLAAAAEKAQADKIDAKWDQKQRDEAAKALEDAAQKLEQDKQDKARADEEKRLRDEERQLRKQLAEKPDDEELQRRLERNQRELKRLEREKQERAEQQRQLQRLQRELEKAAEQLRQKLSPEALKQLAQQMRQMENEISKLSSQSRAQMQIAEIKEVLRRAGRSSSGDGKQQGMAQKDGKGRPQRGQNGRDGKGGKGDQLREFDERAGGKDPSVMLLGGDGRNSDQRLLLPMPTGPNGNQPGPQGDGKDPGRDPGDGIGDQHDPNLMGDATRLNGQRHETRVQGKDGAGPSRSQTILGSAEKGFASTSYKRVYGDYTAVVEEVMSKEKVPPGYRFYIKRYFQMIKPRE